MKVLLLIMFSLFFSKISLAQKEAFNWIWGVCTEGNPCEGKFGTSVIKFNKDSIERIYNPGYFGEQFYSGTSTISDNYGRLVAVFNGRTLFDSTGNKVDSMTNIPLGQFASGYKSFLFLKLKVDTNIYHLLYNYSKQLEVPIGLLTYCDSNLIDLKIKIDSILGYQIISRDTIEFIDASVPGMIDATRHANGSDWWVIKPGIYRNKFLIGLLSQSDTNFENTETIANPSLINSQVWSAFSSDGSKFYYYISNNIRLLDVYDFDRCTGELSNLRTFNFSNKVSADDFTPFNLSPDGNKLFMLRTNYATMQSYQNLEFDINTGEFHEMIDGPSAPCLTPNLQQILFGNYKYNEDNTFEPYIGVLNNPNEFSDNSNFIPYERPFPTWGYLRVPHNWANHMLGPVDGSSCDTLGLDQDYTWLPKVEEETFLVFPNPSSAALNVRSSLNGKLLFTITDLTGKTVFQNVPLTGNFYLEQELKNLPAGLYYLSLQNEHKRLSKKWVKMGL